MPYDLTDPRQANIVRQKALARGISSSEIERSIKKVTQQQFIQKRGYDPSGNIADLSSLAGKQLAESGVIGLTDIKASRITLDNLSKSIEGRAGLLGPIKGRFNKMNPYATEAQDLQGEIDAARQLIGRALEGGVLRKEDEEKYKKILPKMSDTPAVAKRKIENVYNLLEQKQNSATAGLSGSGYDVGGIEDQQSPGFDLGAEDQTRPPGILEPVRKNVSGQIASPGDLYRDEGGKLGLLGSPQNDPIFKLNKEFGFRVDNSLIRFLADSEFLPIAGSVAGGLTAGIAGGAGGAMAGKAGQEAIRELLNPEERNLSQHAQVVLTEGVVDAVFSGLTLGVGKVGGKTLGIILKKPGSEVAEQVGKETIGEATEQAFKPGGKSLPILGSQEDLLRKAYPLSPGVKAEFTDKQGSSVYSKLIEFLDGNLNKLTDPQEAVKVFEAGKTQVGKEIGESIKGRAVKADEIIPKLEKLIDDIKQPLITGGDKKFVDGVLDIGSLGKNKKMIVPSEYSAGVVRLEEKLTFLKSFAKENNGYIPLEELQTMKKSLSDAFKGTATEISSKKLLQKGYGELMGSIEKYGGEGIKEANVKYYVFDLMKDSALKADEKVIRQAFDAMDLITLGSSTAVSGGNLAVGAGATAIQKFLRNFAKEPLQQLRLVNKLGSYAVEKGNKNALRSVVLSAQKLGFSFGVSETLLKQVGKETTKAVTQPGLDIQPSQQQGPGLDLGQGGGGQHYMYR